MFVSKIAKKLAFLVRRAVSNDREWIVYLRSRGMVIGPDCRIIDRTVPAEPWLVTIGAHVTVTEGCRFLTHDGAIWLARREHPTINRFAPIRIGDNCFIGTNAILLPGTVIGSDSIVAAGSVVRGDVDPGSIVGGVPARRIGSVADYLSRAIGESIPLDENLERRILAGEDQTAVMKSLLIERFGAKEVPGTSFEDLR